MARDAVIVEAVRTPVGRRNGAYSDTHPVDLSAHILESLAERTGIDPAVVDDVVWGVVGQVGEQALNVGRNAVLAAGWPETVPGTTVDRQCGSSQQAVHFAAAGVLSGQYDVAVAGGVEHMTHVPMGASIGANAGFPLGPRFLARYEGQQINQGLGAEMIAERWGFTREQVDEFSLASHQKATAAIDSGAFAKQYAVVPGTGLESDEGVRRDTTLEKLAGLKPAFKEDGVITAGNSSQISDGSGALLITTSEKAAELGLKPLVRLHSFALAGDDPVIMLTAPIPATAKVLKKSGLSISDIGAFEINEAFAPVPMAWLKETGADPKALNPLGGAIAIGHPLGGSGAILMTRLVHHMVDNGIKYGLQSMCEGGGMANATILELL
jgi:acetyl-CoA acyltransferase